MESIASSKCVSAIPNSCIVRDILLGCGESQHSIEHGCSPTSEILNPFRSRVLLYKSRLAQKTNLFQSLRIVLRQLYFLPKFRGCMCSLDRFHI